MSKIPNDMKNKNKFQEAFEDNPELKQLLFFGFYIVFFIFIVVLLRSAFASSNNRLTRYNSGYNYSFKLKEIAGRNYHFYYKLTKNSQTVIFDGDKNDNIENFVMSGNPTIQYYNDNNNYYAKNNNTLIYEKTTNPMDFYKVIELENLRKLFVHGTYISKTEYLDGEGEDDTYQISTSSMLRNLDNVESDLDSVNTVVVKVNKDDVLSEVNLDLTNYYHYYDSSIYEYKLSLIYSKIGEVGNISVER